jgi:hypothetical protein
MKHSTSATAAALTLSLVTLMAAFSPAGAAASQSTNQVVYTGLYSGYTGAGHAITFRIDHNGIVGPFSTTVLFNCSTTDGETRTRYATFALPATYLTSGGRFAGHADGAVVSANDQPRFSIAGRVAGNYASGALSISQTSAVIGHGLYGVHIATEFCVSPVVSWSARLVAH